MGVYEPLERHLIELDRQVWLASFSEIENLLHRPLPQSAYEYREWWGNTKSGNHSQSRAWREAGWKVESVDLAEKKVRFARIADERTRAPAHAPLPLEELWAKAHKMSGIDDRDLLLEKALSELIQREAGRRLIEMGGTMPDFEPAPRERPFP